MRKAAITLLALLASAGPAAANWLVTKEGARIETDGPWEIKGAVVLFTLPNGTLSSMRLSEVDLDRSAEATYDAENPPPPPPAEEEAPRQPVLVLTNKDVPRARDVPGGAAEEGEGPAAGGPAAGGPAVAVNEPYGLLDWELRPAGDGVEVRGRLVNNGEEGVLGVVMVVALYTAGGIRYAETSAVLGTASLQPGASTPFRSSFPRVAVDDYRVAVEVEARPPRER